MIEKINGVEFGNLQIVRKITSLKGFIEIFEDELRKGNSLTISYEHTEELHERLIGKRKYSCYDSFRHVRARNIFHGMKKAV